MNVCFREREREGLEEERVGEGIYIGVRCGVRERERERERALKRVVDNFVIFILNFYF